MIELNLPAWLSEALCAQVDPELFWPEKGGSNRPAKMICSRCPVREACLDAALSLPPAEDRHGILGGLSDRERRKIRAERQAA